MIGGGPPGYPPLASLRLLASLTLRDGVVVSFR